MTILEWIDYGFIVVFFLLVGIWQGFLPEAAIKAVQAVNTSFV